MNECIGFSQNFENFEIINCELNPNEFYQWDSSITNKQNVQIETNEFSIVKFKLQTDLYYCKNCNQLHLKTNNYNLIECSSKPTLPESNLFSLNELLFTGSNLNKFSLSNKKSNDIFFTLKTKRNLIKKKLDTVKMSLSFCKDTIQNSEQKVRVYCDQVKKQIQFHHQHKTEQLIENRNQLFKELNCYREKCIDSINRQDPQWDEFKIFYLKYQIDPNLITFFLDAKIDVEQSKNQIDLINKFINDLDEKKKQLNSYLLMNKTIKFMPQFSDKLNESMNQIGTMSSTDLCPNEFKIQDIEQYNRLNESILTKSTSEVLNSMNYDAEIIQKHEHCLVTIHSIDNNILLCNRYAKSTELGQVYCDLILIDYFGNLTKQVTFKNSLVRCLTTNSQYILFTIEKDDENQLSKQFSLVLYDSKLELVKSIEIESINPIAVYMDEQRCFLMSNSLPIISVYDLNLSLITRFGQDINSHFGYYTLKSTEYFTVKNDKLCLSEKSADQTGTQLTVIDLTTGNCIKQLTIPYQFSKFHLFFNIALFDLMFIDENKLICFDLLTDKLKFKTTLLNDSNITTYCFNSQGFLACLFQNLNLISVY